MGYFDGLVSSSFKKDVQGNSVFYPWGIMGKGYVLRSATEEEKLRRALKINYMIMLPFVAIITQLSHGALQSLLLVPIYCLFYALWVRRVTRGSSSSSEKLSMGEAYQNSARSHNLPTLILLEIFALGFVAIGFWMISEGEKPLIAGLCVGFFGLCAAAIGYMIKQKVKG